MNYIVYKGWSDRFDCDSRYYEKLVTEQAIGFVDLYQQLKIIHKKRPFKDFNIKNATELKEKIDHFSEVQLTFKDEEYDTYYTVLTLIKIR